MATDQARPNPRGTGLDQWFGVKRRHIWDDDLLGIALGFTVMAFLLCVLSLATQSTVDKHRRDARPSVPLIVLTSISVVAIAVFGAVLA